MRTSREATAKAPGKTSRTIRTAAARGKALGEDTLKAIDGTSLAMDALAVMPAPERAAIVKRAKAGERRVDSTSVRYM